MTRNKIGIGAGAAILAGAAAYAIFKYSKMSDEQKRNLVGDLKEKGKKFYDDNVHGLKNMFSKKELAKNGYAHA